MSKSENAKPQARKAWVKPTVKQIAVVRETRGGFVLNGPQEDAFYTPS